MPPLHLHFCTSAGGAGSTAGSHDAGASRSQGYNNLGVTKDRKRKLCCYVWSLQLSYCQLYFTGYLQGHQVTRAPGHTSTRCRSPGHTLQRLCLYTTQCRDRIKHCTGVPLSETVEHCMYNTQKNRLLCWAEYIDIKGRQKEGGHTEEFMLLDPKFIEMNVIACN